MGKRDTAIFLTAIALTVLGVVRVFYEAAVPTASCAPTPASTAPPPRAPLRSTRYPCSAISRRSF